MKTIKGILIDPSTSSIQEVDVEVSDDNSTLKGMYKLLGCNCVDVGRRGLEYLPSQPDDDVWFDDEGLFREDNPGQFVIPGWVPLSGNGLILGYDRNGDCTSHNLTEEDLVLLRTTVLFIQGKKEN
eukprot:TRINITY_DN37085_c0_g1_i2.p3 TRINITY_DN37085_c0_g1~~TRINITY_DN37085_c0_g1_i2.p3  ORF type:complete len:126 (-),score=12.66 TRINITY_DN37085_c0_g1_i2:270-647(-)